MNTSLYEYPQRQLQQLMERVNCASLPKLSQLSGLSSWQLERVRHGLIAQLSTGDLVKLANALQVPVSELLSRFGISTVAIVDRSAELAVLHEEYQNLRQKFDRQQEELAGEWQRESVELAVLREEYQNLRQKLDRQKEELVGEWQRESIEAIESWLVQWPTAEAVARKHSDLSAVKILPLVKPIWNLLQRWGMEPIHHVGEYVPYDPRTHQLIDGMAEPDTIVLVRYVGYRHGEKLLYRAKVSLITVEIPEIATERVPVKQEV